MQDVRNYALSEEELNKARTEIEAMWGAEVEAKLDPLLEHDILTVVTPELEAEPTDTLRVIVRYRKMDGFESLLETYEADIEARGEEAAPPPLTAPKSRMEFIDSIASTEAAQFASRIRLEGAQIEGRLTLGEAVVANLTPGQIRALAQRPDVMKLEADRVMELELVESTKTIGIPAAVSLGVGATGKGIIVAVIDGECDPNHPDLKGRVVQKRDYTGEGFGVISKDLPASVHGTHVSGIIAGNGATYRGVAPEATIWNYKVYASEQTLSGEGFKGAQAIEDAIKDGAHVINCSWGVRDTPRDGSCLWCTTVERAAKLGVVLTKSAGNNGPDPGTTTCPANARGDVIVVGSTLRDGADVMERSSRGPTADGRTKPDVIAPGELITSAAPRGGYRRLSGTSMASPHVAGLAALMLQKNSSLKAADVKRILMETASRVASTEAEGPNAQGQGLIRAVEALQRTGPGRTPPPLMLQDPISPMASIKGVRCVAQMEISVKNAADQPLRDVKATIKPTGAGARVPEGQKYLGDLAAGTQASAMVDIEVPYGGTAGPVDFELTVTYTMNGMSRTSRRIIKYEMGPAPVGAPQPEPTTPVQPAPMTPAQPPARMPGALEKPMPECPPPGAGAETGAVPATPPGGGVRVRPFR